MSEYARQLFSLSDEQLALQLSNSMPGSTNHELVRFEIQRRAYVAQKLAADATLRSAKATEKYTLATWLLLFVTVIGVLMNVLKS